MLCISSFKYLLNNENRKLKNSIIIHFIVYSYLLRYVPIKSFKYLSNNENGKLKNSIIINFNYFLRQYFSVYSYLLCYVLIKVRELITLEVRILEISFVNCPIESAISVRVSGTYPTDADAAVQSVQRISVTRGEREKKKESVRYFLFYLFFEVSWDIGLIMESATSKCYGYIVMTVRTASDRWNTLLISKNRPSANGEYRPANVKFRVDIAVGSIHFSLK